MKTLFPFFLSIVFINIVLFPVGIKADEPLPPPTDYSISSANGKFTASFQVKEKKTTVYKLNKSSGKQNKIKMWEMDGWYRNTFLSNDGDNLIVVYEGANLLSLDYKPDEIMLSFYDKGNLINEIRLNQLIKNPAPENLEKTASHYRWVDTYGMNEKQIFEVNTVEKETYLFDIKTGLPIKGTLYVPAENSPAPSTSSEISNINNTSVVKQKVPPTNSNVNAAPSKENTRNCQNTLLGFIGFTFLLSFFVNT